MKKLVITDENAELYRKYIDIIYTNNNTKLDEIFFWLDCITLIINMLVMFVGMPMLIGGAAGFFLYRILETSMKHSVIFAMLSAIGTEALSLTTIDKVINFSENIHEKHKILYSSIKQNHKEFLKENPNLDLNFSLEDISYALMLYDAHNAVKKLDVQTIKQFQIYSASFKLLPTEDKIRLVKENLKFLQKLEQLEEDDEEYLEDLRQQQGVLEQPKVRKFVMYDLKETRK